MTRLEFKQRLSIAIGAAKGYRTFILLHLPWRLMLWKIVKCETNRVSELRILNCRSESPAHPGTSVDPQGLQDEQRPR
jgi:hypothetical protein